MLAFEEQLYLKLAGGTALTGLLGGTEIYNALGARGSANTYPMVMFTKSSGVDDNSSPKRAKTLVYQVTGISDKGKKEAEQIDDACDALVHNASFGSITAWGNYWCTRDSDISYVEQISGGKVLWHEGGLYRVLIAQ
jgi:hypothetical protein